MTLVLSAGRAGFFTLMSTDTRKVTVKYRQDLKTGKYKQEPGYKQQVKSDKLKKVEFLSNFVAIGCGGINDLAIFIKDEMKKRSLPGDDLSKCKINLEKMLKEIENGEVTDDLKDYLKSDYGVGVILNGFYDNGDTGQITFYSGSPISESRASRDDPDIYFQSSITPTLNLEQKNLFEQCILKSISQGNFNVDGLGNAMSYYQSLVSYFHPVQVSTDIHFFVIMRQGDEIIQGPFSMDTKEMYPFIEDNLKQLESIFNSKK